MYSITIENPQTGRGAMYLCIKAEEADLLGLAFNAFSEFHGIQKFLVTVQQQEITGEEYE